MIARQFKGEIVGLKLAKSTPALWATKTPIASKYEFTPIALMPSGAGGTSICVGLFTVIIWAWLLLKLKIALPPQAVAGTITASTSFAQISR